MAQAYDTGNLTGSPLQYLLPTYYDRVLLEQLQKQTVLYGLGDMKPLPQGGGNIVKWSRYSNMGPVNAITEGTTPTPIALSAVNVTAILTQFAGVTTTSDLLEMTAIDNQIESAVTQLGYQAALTIDTYIRNTILGITGHGVSSVDYMPPAAEGQVARNGFLIKYYRDRKLPSAVGSTENADVKEIQDVVGYLRTLNAQPYDDGYFIGVAHPKVLTDLMKDSTAVISWAAWNEYTNPEAMYRGEVGRIGGVRFIESTNMFFHNSGVGAGATAHYTPIFGKGAFGVVDINGGVKTYVVPSSQVDSNNPVGLFSTIGWKITFASRVLNPSCGILLVTGHV